MDREYNQPWYALKWYQVLFFVVIFLFACLFLGSGVRALAVSAQPAPIWSSNDCHIDHRYVSKSGHVYAKFACGDGKQFNMYYATIADTPNMSGTLLGGKAYCEETPSVFDYGSTVISCADVQ